MPKTPSDIIDEKGGSAAFAKAVGVNAGNVRIWKHRDQFPRSAWPEISQAYPGLTLDVLLRVERAAALRRRKEAA